MTRIRIKDTTPVNRNCSAHLSRIEANLARIVGPQGAQALRLRSRQLCGERAQSRALQLQHLLQLVRKFLGKQLARWLLRSASSGASIQSTRLR